MTLPQNLAWVRIPEDCGINPGCLDMRWSQEVPSPGLVCDFCAQAISKVLYKEDAVKDVDVNMDKAMITINLKDGHDIDNNKLTELIINAGYNIEKIHRVK